MTNEEAKKIIARVRTKGSYVGDYYMGFTDSSVPFNQDIDILAEALEKQSHICSNCKYFNKDWTYTCTEVHLCTKHNIARNEDAFCSDWECD